MDYNHIFLENRQYTNKTMLAWLNVMAGIVVFLWAFSLLHIISLPTRSFLFTAPVCVILLLVPTFVYHIGHFNEVSKVGKKGVCFFTKFLISISIVAIFVFSVSVSYYAAVIWMFPMLIACQYYSKRITKYTFSLCICGFILSYFLSLYFGAWDNNLIYLEKSEGRRILSLQILGQACLYLLPRLICFCASFPLFYAITSRTELLLKKQNLSMMANEAKKTLTELQEFPDTFVTDCKIKMRYLSKNNIDIDTALQAIDGNVEKYNDLVLTFLGESHRKEDELFSLLEADTLLQYGAKVHALRVKANALGLKNLTDTAFFHEMEAYAGNLDIVQANWEKLSFEWDEACDLFTSYITSLGLKNHATDANGKQISFQEWGNQLNEAFQALEVYDTRRARNILNELLKYQIDSDITKNLELIVANIDELLKA